jgi:hypothetical protein
LDLLAKAKLLDERDKELALAPISLKDRISASGSAEASVFLVLPFQGVSPGKYKLTIEITESVSAQSSLLQTDLEFISP